MTSRQIIESVLTKVLAKLPEERLRQVLDFAEFLSLHEEHRMWSQLSAEELAEMYGDDDEE